MGQVSTETKTEAPVTKPEDAHNPSLHDLRVNAEKKMFANTPLAGVAGNPIKDPLFLETSRLDERNRIRREVEAAGSYDGCGTGFCSGDAGYVTGSDDKAYRYRDYVERQHKFAYELLYRGVDIRTVAVKTHLTPEEVDNIRVRFNL